MNKHLKESQNEVLARFSFDWMNTFNEKTLNQYGLTLVIAGSHEQKQQARP